MNSLESLKILKDSYHSDRDIELLNIIEHDLEQYKKIEDELGIDLVTLFKVLTAEDLWWKTITLGIVKTTFKLENIRPSLTYDIENKKWYIDLESHTLVGFELLEDYGRTWALTKEELENDE